MNKFTLFIVSGKNPPCRTSTRWIEIVFEIDLAFLAGADFLQNVAESERIYRFSWVFMGVFNCAFCTRNKKLKTFLQ